MWILDSYLKTLRQKEVPLVKVLWSRHDDEEATWELEDEMWQHFLGLFTLNVA